MTQPSAKQSRRCQSDRGRGRCGRGGLRLSEARHWRLVIPPLHMSARGAVIGPLPLPRHFTHLRYCRSGGAFTEKILAAPWFRCRQIQGAVR